MFDKLLSGISAGVLIAIGGSVFLAAPDKITGSVFFCVALLSICYKGYALFTGKVGYLPEKHDGEAVSVLLWGLIGNLIGTLAAGLLVRYAIPSIGEAAEALCDGKLAAQTPLQTFIRAIFCGILMYLAVSIFRDAKTPAGILFCIPTFILAGFEHSIADMFYFFAAARFIPETALYLVLVVLGNAVGGVMLPIFNRVWRKK